MPSATDLFLGSRALCPVPFHRSASVSFGVLVVYPPTAMQADTAGQATAGGSMSYAWPGVGVAWMRQPVLVHRSARVSGPEGVR